MISNANKSRSLVVNEVKSLARKKTVLLFTGCFRLEEDRKDCWKPPVVSLHQRVIDGRLLSTRAKHANRHIILFAKAVII